MYKRQILQFIDASNLCVSGRSVNRAFFSLFPKLEDIVGNLIVGLFVIGLSLIHILEDWSCTMPFTWDLYSALTGRQ